VPSIKANPAAISPYIRLNVKPKTNMSILIPPQ
jgi:hypothetical protein